LVLELVTKKQRKKILAGWMEGRGKRDDGREKRREMGVSTADKRDDGSATPRGVEF
jgi:hypothetical protein